MIYSTDTYAAGIQRIFSAAAAQLGIEVCARVCARSRSLSRADDATPQVVSAESFAMDNAEEAGPSRVAAVKNTRARVIILFAVDEDAQFILREAATQGLTGPGTWRARVCSPAPLSHASLHAASQATRGWASTAGPTRACSPTSSEWWIRAWWPLCRYGAGAHGALPSAERCAVLQGMIGLRPSVATGSQEYINFLDAYRVRQRGSRLPVRAR